VPFDEREKTLQCDTGFCAAKKVDPSTTITIYDKEVFWQAWDDIVEEVIEYHDEAVNEWVADKMYSALYKMAEQMNPPVGHWRLNNPDIQTFKDLSCDKS
jgi:hypothetical protein